MLSKMTFTENQRKVAPDLQMREATGFGFPYCYVKIRGSQNCGFPFAQVISRQTHTAWGSQGVQRDIQPIPVLSLLLGDQPA